MLILKLFLWDVETDEEIPGDAPLEASCGAALKRLRDLSAVDGSFIGFELPSKEIVQFMWDDEETLHVDIPAKNGSYGKDVSQEEAERIITGLFNGLNPVHIEGLTFESY